MGGGSKAGVLSQSGSTEPETEGPTPVKVGGVKKYLALAIVPGLWAADEFEALRHPQPGAILSGYLQGLARQQLAERRATVAAISDKAGFEERKKRLRTEIGKMLGGQNDPRTPLNLRKTGTLVRDGYRVDKIVYESRPRFYVTANLYVPNGKGPFAAVLQPVGHSTAAKNRAFYQRIALALVKQGLAVLTYDPIGQGERSIYWDREWGASKTGSSTTTEHNMVGWQSLLAGESVARYMVWDGLRSLDVLASLPEVDGKRIGVAGCSGGGTLTTYLAALDERVKAAAPACYISSWEEQLQGTGPQDAEQQFPDQLRAGLDHADWVGLAAPKPYLVLSTDEDFFPLEGARKTFAEMKRVYELYDAGAKVEWFHEPGGHGVPAASRQKLVSFMRRWLMGTDAAIAEPELMTEHEEDLNVTPTGQVATSWGGETASTENMRRYRLKLPARPIKSEDLAERVRRLTRFERSREPLGIERTGTLEKADFRVQLLSYRPQPGLLVAAALAEPTKGNGKLVLYLDEAGKGRGLAENGDARQLVRLGYTVFAVDVSGTGEVAFARHAGAQWGMPQVAWLALMVGRPLIGIRMNDVVRGLDALQEMGRLPADGVLGFARGKLGPVLLHTAVVDSRIASVMAEDSLVSYAAVAASPLHAGIEELVVPGVLGQYDLPDLAAALTPRRVWLSNLRGPTGKLLLKREATAAYGHAAGSGLQIGLRREEEPVEAAYPGLK